MPPFFLQKSKLILLYVSLKTQLLQSIKTPENSKQTIITFGICHNIVL